MVAERIKLTMTAASARRKGEGKPQAAQQEDPELRAGYGDLVAGKKDIQGSGGEGPGLRQQQRSRRGCEVSKVRLRGARIAGAGSKALPALERPRITGGFSIIAFQECHSQERLRKDGGCGRGEGAVAAEGTKQPVRRSWGTGMDDGQGVAPRGPMRGKAIGGGRAEAKTPEPLRELGSAEAVIRRRGAASCSRSVARQWATAASCAAA